jgi:PAS domain-containing protein
MRPGNPAPPTGEITPDTAGEWLSMVARATGYGVTLLDAQYQIVWANDAFTDLSGYSAAEFIGR